MSKNPLNHNISTTYSQFSLIINFAWRMLSRLFQHFLAPTAVVLYSGPQLSEQTHFNNFIKATPIWLRHNIFHTAKSIWSQQNQFHHGKFIFTTAESFLLHDSNDVTLARKVPWEPFQHGSDLTELIKMFWANCGFTLPDGANFCIQCGKGML